MDMTEIIVALIGLLTTILTVVIVPLIKSKTTSQQQEELSKWVKIAVMASEQIINGTETGQEKKQFVLDWLAEHGIKIDDVEILDKVDLMIEAFVAEMNVNKKAKPIADTTEVALKDGV